jgi:hypothetical protein
LGAISGTGELRMQLELIVRGKIGEDFPEEYFLTPEKTALFYKASKSALRERYNLGSDVSIKFVVK